MQRNNDGKPLPNTDYHNFYNKHNNPFQAGYGVDENTQRAESEYDNYENEVYNNCNRLNEVSFNF